MLMSMTLDQLAHNLALSGDLEHDAQSHSSFYYEVCRAAAQAENHAEQMKYEQTVTEADLQLKLRSEAAQSGEKITEAGILARMQLTEAYQKAAQDYLAAKADMREWLALKASYESRSYMINNLTTLAARGVSSSGITNQYETLRKQQAAARNPVNRAPLNNKR